MTTKSGFDGGCADDYELVSCETYTPSATLDDWYIQTSGGCYVQQDNYQPQYAIGICCQLRGTAGDKSLTVTDLDQGDYTFTITAPEGTTGTFSVTIQCSSDSPSKAPSTEPTPAPTPIPTESPTPYPTFQPSQTPSDEPSVSPTPTLQCPGDSSQIGDINADIGGCGLEACNARYAITSIEDCKAKCDNDVRCKSFSWAPYGDRNHINQLVCTIYGTRTSNQLWGPNQILCAKATLEPSPYPTPYPSDNPTTPSPTDPGELQCGDEIYGPYAGIPISIEVQLPYNGDLSIDASNSDFSIVSLKGREYKGEATSGQGKVLGTDTDLDGRLTLSNLERGDYQFVINGGTDPGTFDVVITCESDSPTKAPSQEPTKSPTDEPTPSPSPQPSDSPSKEPSPAPTPDPTPYPTDQPSLSPTETLVCPGGSTQIGAINADIGGCGLESCGARYDIPTIEDCQEKCFSNDNCLSFSWAPYGGDRNHVNQLVCTIYNGKVPNQVWGPYQILCAKPTSEPTTSPTNEPSPSPTPYPTDNPTTPAPTDPDEIYCGQEASGPYHGALVTVEVRVEYESDLIIDTTESDFQISSLFGALKTGDGTTELLGEDTDGDGVLELNNVDYGDYIITLTGTDEAGTFKVLTSCQSEMPTAAPTTKEPSPNPTPDPTPNPTYQPSKAPTDEPSASPSDEPSSSPSEEPSASPSNEPSTSPSDEPSVSPSEEPTVSPSDGPTRNPTTPAPSDPDEMTCGDEDTGDYNGEVLNFEVRIPYEGDIKFDMSGSDFQVIDITGIDYNDGENKGEIIDTTEGNERILTLFDVGSGDYVFRVTGPAEVKSTFHVVISCESDEPTISPTSLSPTKAPSDEPSSAPTNEPSTSPTVNLECPEGSTQIGDINADIAGCGLEDCDDRYSVQSIIDCQQKCNLNNYILSLFFFLPLSP